MLGGGEAGFLAGHSPDAASPIRHPLMRPHPPAPQDEALSALQARMREAVAGAQTAAASSQAAQVRADASGMRVGELAAALAAARARAEEDGGRATLRITELEGKCAQLEERMHSEAQAARREADARVAQAAQTQAEAVERLTAEVRRLKDAGQATAAEEEEWQEERRACQMRGEDASPLSPAVDRVQQPAPDPPRRATPSESPSGMFSALRRDAAAVSAALRGGSIPAAKVALDHLQATLTRAEGEVSEALGQPSTIAETLVDLDADAEWSISAATPQSKACLGGRENGLLGSQCVHIGGSIGSRSLPHRLQG